MQCLNIFQQIQFLVSFIFGQRSTKCVNQFKPLRLQHRKVRVVVERQETSNKLEESTPGSVCYSAAQQFSSTCRNKGTVLIKLLCIRSTERRITFTALIRRSESCPRRQTISVLASGHTLKLHRPTIISITFLHTHWKKLLSKRSKWNRTTSNWNRKTMRLTLQKISFSWAILDCFTISDD